SLIARGDLAKRELAGRSHWLTNPAHQFPDHLGLARRAVVAVVAHARNLLLTASSSPAPSPAAPAAGPGTMAVPSSLAALLPWRLRVRLRLRVSHASHPPSRAAWHSPE